MLADGRFWVGVFFGVAGVWAYHKYVTSRSGGTQA